MRALASRAEEQSIGAASGRLKISDVTVQFLEERRHAQALGEFKRKSLANYEYIVERLINEYIGNLPVKALDKAVLMRWQAALVKAGVNVSSRRNAVGQLKQAFAAAVEAGTLQVNPVAKFPAPKKIKREMLYWTPSEAAARSHRLYALFVVAIELGLRRGELMGLRCGRTCTCACRR